MDPDSATKDIDDVSKIAKYEISEDDYNKQPDNFRKFKEKLVKANPDLAPKKEKIVKDEDYMKEEAMKFDVRVSRILYPLIFLIDLGGSEMPLDRNWP